MPTRSMGVAVGYLFRLGGAYIDDVDIEDQGFTCHREVNRGITTVPVLGIGNR